jgi:hypothetical protein
LTFAADGKGLHSGDVATTNLDGVQLEVGYVPPAVETTRCPAGGTDPCNIVTNTVDNALFLHGTVYAPKATLEAAVHNYGTTVFERGVIAAAAVIHVSASVKQTLPPFQLPRGPNDRVVRFTAQAWENGAWRTRLVALVKYDDYINRPGGKTSASPGHRMTVTRWTVVR